jgi:PAS domain S-box-containing protein
MVDKTESEDESKQLRATLLETATTVLQIRQRAEQEIRRTNEILEERTRELAQALMIMRATLESTTDGILVTDEDAKATQFNEKYIAMWKMPLEVVEGGMASDLQKLASQNFEDPPRFIARVKEIAASGRESFDQLQLKDGRTLERYSKVLTVEGKGAGRVWSFRDVTKRRLAEITSHRLGAIVASSDDAIVGKDLNGIVTSWNFGAERIFGYFADEMIGTSIMRLIPPDRREEEIEILSRIRRGERFGHFETIRLAKNGRLINVSITVSPIKDSSGQVIGASKVARDITERKKTEEALKAAMEETEAARDQAERASRMKDEFLATLSHELRTPLNAVLGWANVLLMKKLQDEELKQGLETIERNARVQAQIIEELLDMSRIVSGKVRLEMQRIDLSDVLNESIETLRATAKAKGVSVEVVEGPLAGLIFADPNRLQQVFWNLLHNAIKFTPEHGKVKVVLKSADSHVEVRVIDTGEGIPPKFLPYVFERFQQGDASTTRRHGGLGLGLAIVKELVELHGGKVQVQSGGIGQGATFIVLLPLGPVHSEPEESHRPQTGLYENKLLPDDVSLAHIHVLVVDDEIDARNLTKRLLEMAGATVAIAASAAEAMEHILAKRPDVLVCDIGMPDEDGYSLIKRLRITQKIEKNALPAVALSAYARPEDRTKAIRSGFQNHLAKPVEPAELLAIVRSLADRKAATSRGVD